MDDGDKRTQHDGDRAAVKMISRAVRPGHPGREFTTGTESTEVAMDPIMGGPGRAALAPMAPPG